MQIIHRCCCGLDVHKKLIVACLISLHEAGEVQKEIRCFPTMTKDILALADWLTSAGCTHVAMESTGVYWRPIWNLLEGQFELLLVNAHPIKAVPGRKTDIKDAEWMADLLQHGLLRPSFVPPAPQRHLRELTRYRSTLLAERARLVNRLHNVREDTNLKLTAVVTPIDFVDEQVSHCNLKIEQFFSETSDESTELVSPVSDDQPQEQTSVSSPHADAAAMLAQDPVSAEIFIAEVGTDMQRFPTAQHLASWVGLCPGTHQSAGKQLRGTTRKGDRWLRQALIEAAQGAMRTKDTYLSAQGQRLTHRRGKKRAVVPVAHTILIIASHVLQRQQPYQDLGSNYFDERERSAIARQSVRRLEHLGFKVTLETPGEAA
jgi:transposase